MNKEEQEALRDVLDYLWDDEESDYETYEDDGVKQDSHIFLKLVALKTYLDNVKN